MNDDAEQTVDASDRFQAVKRSADRTADRAHYDSDDQCDEDGKHRVEVEDLLHLGRVLIVEPEHGKQGAEEEDLRQQRLDHAALVADDQRNDQHENDDYIDDHPRTLMPRSAA